MIADPQSSILIQFVRMKVDAMNAYWIEEVKY